MQDNYVILMNPNAGNGDPEQTKAVLEGFAARYFDGCPVLGFSLDSAEQFRLLAQDAGNRFRHIIVASGDGGLIDVINSVNLGCNRISHLHTGTGNKTKDSLGLGKLSLEETARRISQGEEHRLDLVYDGAIKGFIASVGLEADVVKRWEEKRYKGNNHMDEYTKIVIQTFAGFSTRTGAEVTIDNSEVIPVSNFLSAIIAKMSHFGCSVPAIPKAQPDDGMLHVLLQSGKLVPTLSYFSNRLFGMPFGVYRTATEVRVRTEESRNSQMDGHILKENSTDFNFVILPRALRMVY